jgi:hypothetical protein
MPRRQDGSCVNVSPFKIRFEQFAQTPPRRQAAVGWVNSIAGDHFSGRGAHER